MAYFYSSYYYFIVTVRVNLNHIGVCVCVCVCVRESDTIAHIGVYCTDEHINQAMSANEGRCFS